ncbi:MAG TPA: hypothetical protein VEC57_15565 [Candidatus Limnocylindrales bacterium]|nr:hypothetical protein [Candidatus Limnocylindrales bacterium]
MQRLQLTQRVVVEGGDAALRERTDGTREEAVAHEGDGPADAARVGVSGWRCGRRLAVDAVFVVVVALGVSEARDGVGVEG